MGNRKSQQKNLRNAINLIDSKNKHILEFGVDTGKSLKYIIQTAGKSYDYFGFDSFIGLPEDWVVTKEGEHYGYIVGHKGRDFNNNGVIPNIEGVKFYKGFFETTLPEYLSIAENIAFLHMDADLYSSTKEVLYALNDYIVPGTIIVFDEWVYKHSKEFDDHEAKAFYEWVKDNDREYEFYDFLGDKDSLGYPEQKTIKIIK